MRGLSRGDALVMDVLAHAPRSLKVSLKFCNWKENLLVVYRIESTVFNANFYAHNRLMQFVSTWCSKSPTSKAKVGMWVSK